MSDELNDPLFHDEPKSMAARILPPLVLICAFGGFVALAIYAYQAGSQSVADGELMVVEADKTPIKEKPEDPGGMQFPNQDKTIFETFAAGQQPAQVERVLPTPEEPIAPVENGLAPETAAPASGSEQLIGEDDAPATVKGPQVVNVQEALSKQAPAEEAKPAPVELKKEPLLEVAPIETKTETVVVKEEPKIEPKVEKPAAPAKVAGSGSGTQLAQLGAYRAEADAKADFARMQKKYPALIGKTPVINRADLGDKGIFYRLRVSTDNAKALCGALSAAGQACMVVK